MSLEESVGKICELSRIVDANHAPFLEAIDQAISFLEEISRGIQDPKACDLMRETVGKIKERRSEFLRVFPADIASLRENIIRDSDEMASRVLEFQKVHNEGVVTLAALEASIPERIEAARAEMLASVPKPPPAPEPISINPGEELVARLMELGAPAKPPSKTMPSPGNIWENWKPGQGAS